MKSIMTLGLVTAAMLGSTGRTRAYEAEIDVTQMKVAASLNQFAFDFHGHLSREVEGNIAWSPYSYAMALGMCREGAEGKTLEELNKVLHLGAGVHASDMGDLMKTLESSKDFSLHSANGIWHAEGFPLLPGFQKTLEENFRAHVRKADFGASEAVRTEINGWVEKQTQGRILDLLPQVSLSGQTSSVMVNAVHFQGPWARAFDPTKSREMMFRGDAPGGMTEKTAAKEFPVRMMVEPSMPARLGKADGWQILELPFVFNGKSGSLSFVALLSDKGDLRDREGALDAASWDRLMGSLKDDHVEVQIPRFKLHAGVDANRGRSILASMGMKSALSPTEADFSRMSDAGKTGMGPIEHKMFIEVKEDGAEAAAATAIVHTMEDVEESASFRADRPFLWAIIHKPSGLVLFMGRMEDPRN
ncbi:MAG: serpin family protein [Planctomycetota bacterium]